MKIKRLRLQNIRSYADQTVDFPDGTILIHGPNGAGKTSLLMGIFGGLFLSGIRNVGSNSFTLDEFVRRGETKGVVELQFEIGGADYTVEWEIHATSTPNDATLTSPRLSTPVSGISDVREEITNLLGMDEDDFASSVYVKQGEIDRLIEANDRAAMIDGLLGLDEIDDHIETMKMARRGAGQVKRENKNSIEERQKELREEFDRDEGELEDAIADLSRKIKEVESDIEEVENYLDQLRDTRAELQQSINTHEELVEEKKKTEQKIAELKEKRAREQRSVEDCETRIGELEEEITTLEEEIDNLATDVKRDVLTSDAASNALDAVQEDLQKASIEQNDRENALEQAEDSLSELKKELNEVQDKIDKFTERRDTVKSDIDSLRQDLDKAKSELDEAIAERDRRVVNFLPEFNSADAVDETTIAEVEARIDKLEKKQNETNQVIAEHETTLNERQTDLEEKHEALEEAKNALSEVRGELETLYDEKKAVEKRVDSVTDEFETRLSSLNARAQQYGVELSADTLEQVTNKRLSDLLETVNDDLRKVETRIAAFEQQETNLLDTEEELRELESESKCPRCKQPVDEAHLEDEFEEIETDLEETRRQLGDAETEQERLQERKEAIHTLQTDLRDLIEFRDNEVEVAEDELEELRNRESELKSKISDLEREVEEHKSDISELEERKAGLEDKIEGLKEDRSELEEAIGVGESLLEQFEKVEQRKERVEQIETDIEGRQSDLDDVVEDLDEHHEKVEALEAEITEKQDLVAEREQALREIKERVAELEKRKSTLEDIEEYYEKIAEKQSEVDAKERDIEHHHQSIQDLNSRLADLNDELTDIENKLDKADVKELKEKLKKVEDRIEQRKETRNSLQEKDRELRDNRTALKNELSNLRNLQAKIEELEHRAEWANEIESEFDAVLDIYESVKSELREKYLAYINQYTNDIFQGIYMNSSYQRVIVDEVYDERSDSYDYDIQLMCDDGMTEDPSNASGGERALINLALRAGIYKLIAELEGGERGKLPPFILDEPTTFLDEGHVGQLEEMLDKIKDWDVPQVIVVSHDEALIHGADHECRVEISEATDTSQVTIRSASLEAD